MKVLKRSEKSHTNSPINIKNVDYLLVILWSEDNNDKQNSQGHYNKENHSLITMVNMQENDKTNWTN